MIRSFGLVITGKPMATRLLGLLNELIPILTILVCLFLISNMEVFEVPIATVMDPNERFELKSAPPDGYVVIRRMTWGEKLKQQGMQTQMYMEMDRKNKDDVRAEINVLREKVSMWEFANLVVEHNLTDASNRMLNFKNQADVASLGPKIGEEIQKYIDDVNSFEDSDELKN